MYQIESRKLIATGIGAALALGGGGLAVWYVAGGPGRDSGSHILHPRQPSNDPNSQDAIAAQLDGPWHSAKIRMVSSGNDESIRVDSWRILQDPIGPDVIAKIGSTFQLVKVVNGTSEFTALPPRVSNIVRGFKLYSGVVEFDKTPCGEQVSFTPDNPDGGFDTLNENCTSGDSALLQKNSLIPAHTPVSTQLMLQSHNPSTNTNFSTTTIPVRN